MHSGKFIVTFIIFSFEVLKHYKKKKLEWACAHFPNCCGNRGLSVGQFVQTLLCSDHVRSVKTFLIFFGLAI